MHLQAVTNLSNQGHRKMINGRGPQGAKYIIAAMCGTNIYSFSYIPAQSMHAYAPRKILKIRCSEIEF